MTNHTYFLKLLFILTIVSCTYSCRNTSNKNDIIASLVDSNENIDNNLPDSLKSISDISFLNGYKISHQSSTLRFDGKNYSIFILSNNTSSKVLLIQVIEDPKYKNVSQPVHLKLSGIREKDPLITFHLFNVLDTISYNTTFSPKYLTWGCRKNSIYQQNIVGLFEYQDSKYIKHPIKAWKLNYEYSTITEIDSSYVNCLNPDYEIPTDIGHQDAPDSTPSITIEEAIKLFSNESE